MEDKPTTAAGSAMSRHNPWPTILAGGVLAELGLFLALWLMFDNARMASGILVAGHVVAILISLGAWLSFRATSSTVAHIADALQLQPPAEHAAPPAPAVDGQWRVIQQPAKAQLAPPIAPQFAPVPKTVRVLLTDGTLPEVDHELIKAFITECYPDCNRERWRHTNAEYGNVAGVLSRMRGAPLEEYQRERYRWHQWATREMLEDWYQRVVKEGVDA